MKTFEELNDAMQILTTEAYESGFTVFAAISSAQQEENGTGFHTCGNNLVCIALADVMREKLLKPYIE